MNPLFVTVAVVLSFSACGVGFETSSCGPAGCTSSRGGTFTSQSIGESCANDGECSGSMVCDDGAPNGYCLQVGCSAGTCPSGGVCVVGSRSNFCAKSCSSASDCRPGYLCQRFTNSSRGWCAYQ